MRHLIIAISLALGLASTAVLAQPGAEERSARAEQHAQKRLDRMTEQLNLTAAQQIQVEAIFAEQAAARREMHQRHRSERQSLMEQGKARMSEVLSAEQQAQWQEMRAERKARSDGARGQRRHRHGGH